MVHGRDVVVVAASAGGVEALQGLCGGLPPDLPASLLVVLHLPSGSQSVLPQILSRAGPLPAESARTGQRLEPGHIYVAPPDLHLMVSDGYVQTVRGPRENGYRPAADVLFRSAAASYGPRVVGVVLSGALEDGAAGLRTIKQRGGVAIVQDPSEAAFPSMPRSGLAATQVDYCLPVAQIGAVLAELAAAAAPPTLRTTLAEPDVSPQEPSPRHPSNEPSRLELENRLSALDPGFLQQPTRPGRPSSFGCPACGGVLWELEDGDHLRYRCRVGHGYTQEVLQNHMAEEVEEALWTALRALEEKHEMSRRLQQRAADSGQTRALERFRQDADQAGASADVVRKLLLSVNEAVPGVQDNGGEEVA